MDFERLAADWLRFVRGKRSQRAFSNRLGYGSNIAYRWESRVCFPSAAQTFALAARFAPRERQSLAGFLGASSADFVEPDLGTPAGVAELLRALRGKTKVVELASRSGLSRFSIARWLSGTAEPRLPEFLALVEAATLRALDFLSHFVPLELLPTVGDEWRALQAARKAAYDVPWSHAVLRALELTDYQCQQRPKPGWIARRLGISRAEETRCLTALAAAHQIRKDGAHWLVARTQTIDTRSDPARARKLKAEWLKVALARFESGVQGTFGYNLMAISKADFARLKEIHLAYFREMQSLVADSAPSECVVLFNTELFALDASSL